jgi:hypothetical protein
VEEETIACTLSRRGNPLIAAVSRAAVARGIVACRAATTMPPRFTRD